jgi:hypothetical protein
MLVIIMFAAGVVAGRMYRGPDTANIATDTLGPKETSEREWELFDSPGSATPAGTPVAVGRDFYFVDDLTAVINGYISGPIVVYRFETLTGTWTRLADLPRPDNYFLVGVVAWGDDALVVSLDPWAMSLDDNSRTAVFIYDVSTGVWTQTPPVPAPIRMVQTSTMGDSVQQSQLLPDSDSLYLTYVFGLPGDEDLGIWRYERASGTWSAPFHGPDESLASIDPEEYVFRSAELSDGRLLFRVYTSMTFVDLLYEWANPQTGLLERFDLFQIPVIGLDGVPDWNSCGYPQFGYVSSLWLCNDGAFPVRAVDVFDFVAGEFVYLGYFQQQSLCADNTCGVRTIPGDLLILGREVINPYSGVRHAIPDLPSELEGASAVAASSMALLVCTTHDCGLYSFR